jgi:type IV pilus assembly protein PilC
LAKIKLDTIVNFTTQFSAMISAHIPLVKILKNLEKDVLDLRFASILKKIREDVEKGNDFATSMKKHPEAFDTIYVNMVNAGMQSGKLDIILKQLSTYLNKASKTANKIKSSLAYPKFMLVAMIVIMTLMLVKVIPMFEKMFSNSKNDLPQLTKIVINLSDFLRENLFIIIFIMIVAYIFLFLYLKTKNGIKIFDTLKIKALFIGTLNKKSSISKFIRTFGVLTSADVPILKAIKLSKSSASNVIIEAELENIVELIERGYGISEAFKKVEIFPDIIIQMISSGEESGNLGELLISSADYYDDQIDNELKSIIALINPTITVIMGLFIALLMMSIFMPIFQMGDMY